jgi:hypothetical protein
MPRTCTVCSHDQRAEIDRALATGNASNRRIASHYGLTERAIRSHKAGHLPARLVKAAEQADVRHAIDVFAQLKAINGAALNVLKEARDVKDGDLALKAIDRIQKQIELQARLIGELQEGATVNVLVAHPEWLAVRATIFAALDGFPAARQAVAAALTEADRGDDRAA